MSKEKLTHSKRKNIHAKQNKKLTPHKKNSHYDNRENSHQKKTLEEGVNSTAVSVGFLEIAFF